MDARRHKGQFISLEGGDGSGKSTQVKNLCAVLRQRNIDVVQTREVGGSLSAESIRELWLTAHEGHWDTLTELFLIMAARREHIVKTIEPALARGAWVVSDRFIDSTRAYQGIAQGLGVPLVDGLFNHISNGVEPDLTLLLDLPVEIGLSRMTARGGQDDRYQQMHAAFHQKLRDGFLTLAHTYKSRFCVIDAAQDVATVSHRIETIVVERYGL